MHFLFPRRESTPRISRKFRVTPPSLPLPTTRVNSVVEQRSVVIVVGSVSVRFEAKVGSFFLREKIQERKSEEFWGFVFVLKSREEGAAGGRFQGARGQSQGTEATAAILRENDLALKSGLLEKKKA